MVADGLTEDEILDAYPDLEQKDIREALYFAAEAVRELNMTRSASIRLALHQYQVRRLEEKDEAGYTAVPVNLTESDEWVTEQAWDINM